MKKTLTIILKSSISGAALLAKRMSHVKQKYLNFRNMRQVSTQKDHISKLRTFLLTSFLSAFVMMIGIIGLPEFFYMQGKGSNISRDFRHCDDHPSRKEVRDQDQEHSKKCDTSFPLLQTLDSFLTFDAILHLLLRWRKLPTSQQCQRHFCFVTHLTLIIRIVGNGA